MPLYFFDLYDGAGHFRDHEGTELSNLEAAQMEATDTLTQVGRDSFRGKTNQTLRIHIRGEDGIVVMHVALSFSAKPMG